MPEPDPFTTHVLGLADVLRRLFESIRLQQEISSAHLYVLGVLIRQGPMKMTELTQVLEMSKGNLTYHVDRMEEAGLLRRAPSQEDRRSTYIELTPGGKAAYDAVIDELRGRLAQLAQRIPAGELDTILAGLSLLMERVTLLEI